MNTTQRALLGGVLALAAACAPRGFNEGVETIRPGGAAPQGPYTPAVRANGFVFFSGVIGTVPGSRNLIEGGIRGETQQALENLQRAMDAAQVERGDVVKCTVFLADIRDYAEMNEVYGEFFRGAPPARSAIGVSGLPAGARVEIECMARSS
jgi:2-iminobutanoate/2-iminopropanoate deaminase